MALMALMNEIQHKKLRKSFTKKKLMSFSELLDLFYKYIAFKDSKSLFRDSRQSKAKKKTNEIHDKEENGVLHDAKPDMKCSDCCPSTNEEFTPLNTT